MKVIPRNHTKIIADIMEGIVAVVRHDRMNTTDELADSDLDKALDDLDSFTYSKLYDYFDGTYTVHVHSNLWYRLYTRSALKRMQASDRPLRSEDLARRHALMPTMRNDSTEQREARIAAALTRKR